MKNKLVIQITEPIDYSKKALAVYRSMGRVVFDSRPLKDAQVLVVGLKHQIDKKWIDAMPNLKIIASPATGYNHLDVEYARTKGIKIISLRGRTSFLKNIPSTAEETMALIFALERHI